MQKQTFAIQLLLTFLLIASLATAQTERRIRLLGIAVEGNQRADAGLVIATSGLVVGNEISGDQIQAAIRQLWGLGLFADIKIVAERATSEGVFLLIRVAEFPRLEFIDIIGGKELGKDEVEKRIGLVKGQVIKPADAVAIRRRLKSFADEKGYLLADIKVEIHDADSPDYKILKVSIKPGTKVKLKRIEFTGNRAFSDRKLRGQLEDTHQRGWFRSGSFNREKFQEDLKRVIDFYRENGYRDAQITGDTIWYSDNLKRMFLQISLDEGVKYYFGNVSFSGQDLISEDELKRQILFRPGDVFNQKKYDATLRENLSTLFYDQGYIYTQITASETLVGADTLNIHIHIEPGNQFEVRKIDISGNTKTREKVIRRELVIHPGDTFDVTKLRRSLRNVSILNYFGNVQPDLEDVDERTVDVHIKVEEKPTDQANLSAGYSERDGVIGAIGFTAPNLFGTGQLLNLDWNFGQRFGSFSLSYTEPWLFDTETLAGISFYDVRRRWVDGFTEKIIGGSLRLGRRFQWPDDYFRGDWTYRLDRNRYTDFSESFKQREDPGLVEGETRISSSLTQVITRDSRDFPEFPTSGSVLSLTTELAGGFLGGNDRYHKHIFSAEWYIPVRPKLVLYTQLLTGFLAGLTGNPRDIPLLEYFFMGGSGLSLGTPLRGYDDRTVGPQASGGGSALGGKTQFKVSSELRIQLVDNPTIYGLLFSEAGNTWRNFDQTDPFNLRRSVGFGLRLYMPLVGLIGLDYGYGLDYFDGSGNRRGQWKPHFQFGRQF